MSRALNTQQLKIMNSNEYYQHQAINSGSLATFYTWDRNIREEPEDKYEFWLGKCFEGVIRGRYDKGYVLPFYPVKDLNKRIIKAIIDGSNLDELVRYKKDGEIYKEDQDIEEQIKIIKGEERSPIDSEDFALIESTVKNLLTIPVIDDLIVSDFLEHAEFDLPVIWKDEEGNECKALFDIVSTLQTNDGNDISVVLDLKYYANQYGFTKMFSSKLWVQERHYTEALKHYCEEKWTTPYYRMPFLVGLKDSGLTQVFMIDDESVDRATVKYLDLKQRYALWLMDDKKETGHLPTRYLKVY